MVGLAAIDGVEVLLVWTSRVGQPVEPDRQVGEAELDGLLDAGLPAVAEVDAPVHRERRRVTAGLGAQLAEPAHAVPHADPVDAGDQQRHPPVGDAHHPAEHRVGGTGAQRRSGSAGRVGG